VKQSAVALEVAVDADGLDLLALHEQFPERFPVLLETAALAMGEAPQFDWLLFTADAADAGNVTLRVSAADAASGRLTGELRIDQPDRCGRRRPIGLAVP